MAGFDIGAIGLRTRVTCPFDPVHVMNFSKFHKHIVECRKKFPNDKRKPCPYNFSEYIDPDKMAEHMEECPYRLDYGTRSRVNVDSSRRIVAPYNVPFGPDIEDESHGPADLGTYRDYRSRRNSSEESDCLSLDDEIDSVSVIAERQKRRAVESNFARSISRDNHTSISGASERPEKSLIGSGSTQSINLGRGRAAFFRRHSALSSQSESSVSLNKDPDEGFSFLCKGNIYPGRKEVTENSSANSPLSSADDERIARLKKLQDDVELEYNKREKLKPRGRGMLFQRS